MTRKFQSQLIAFWRKSFIPQCVKCELYVAILPLSRIGIDVLVGDSRSFLEKK